jgi:membrane fusion protein, macrolide-specific efflux system
MKWKVFAIVALLVGAGVAVGASVGVFGASASAATTYLTAQAAVADVENTVAATGTISSATTYGLSFGAAPGVVTSSSSSSANTPSSSVTWPVTSVSVKVGDTVTKGESLAKAGTTDLTAQISDAVRAADTAAIQLLQAQTQLANASTTDAIRQANMGLYNAQTGNAHAGKSLSDLRAQLALATLTAPDAGVVTAVNIRAGADAPSGYAIEIEAGPLQVTTSVVESDVASISVGQAASVTITALNGTVLDGTVASIDPTGSASGNNGVVSFPVTITLTSPPAALRSGMSADVSITTASAAGVLAIPSRALTGTTGAYRVRVLQANGTVMTVVVTVGLITASLAEIKSGLQAGDTVVTGTSASQNSTTNRAGTGAFGGGTLNGGGGVRVVTP